MGRYLARSCSSEQVRSVEGKSNADLTIIKIRQFRNGWKCFEAPGVEPVFLSQEQAIGYAETRVCYRSGEIRVLDSDGNVERTIAFNQAARML